MFRTNQGRGSNGHGVALFSGSLVAESANATNLQITTQPVGSTSPNLATQPVVVAKKSLGTTDTAYVTNVVPTLNVLTGSATLGGSEAAGKACVAGVCTFTNLTVTAAAGATWTITFTSGSLTSATSSTGTTTTASGRADTFNRADAGTLGTPSDGGSAWALETGASGAFGIVSNQAAITVNSGGDAASLASSLSDCTVAVTIAAYASVSPGLIFRSDGAGHYWMLRPVGSQWWLETYTAPATGTTIATSPSSYTHTDGDILSVVLSGTSIIAKLNGVAITNLSITNATYQTQTRHGIGYQSGALGVRWDNFSVT